MPLQNIVFTDEFCQPERLFPFTLVRSMQDLRVGILTIREKWERSLGLPSLHKSQRNYKDTPAHVDFDQLKGKQHWLLLHGNLLPSAALCKALRGLKEGDCLLGPDGGALAYCVSSRQVVSAHKVKTLRSLQFEQAVQQIHSPWDILQYQEEALRADFTLLTRGRRSAPVPAGNKVLGRKQLFIEKGATLTGAVINATTGPVYVGKEAVIMEGALIRGPFAMLERSCIKMGAKIYGATTLGPGCTAGGEVKHSILMGYSNKAHDGYLGDSIVGEWCNLGAGTTNSNIKNNAGPVRVWTPTGEQTLGQKAGMLMGDYSQTAINTAINTGTVIGLGTQVMGQGLTPKFIPSFSWGQEGIEPYRLAALLETIDRWKKLKGQSLTDHERKMINHLYKKS